MTTEEVGTLLTQGGIGLVAVWLLSRIVWRVGERMIAQIDNLTAASNANTQAMTKAIADSTAANVAAVASMAQAVASSAAAVSQALGAVVERIARVEGKLEGLASAAQWGEDTPVDGQRPRRYPAAVSPAAPREAVEPGAYQFQTPTTPRKPRNG